MNQSSTLGEGDVLRLVSKSGSTESLTDSEVEMLAMTASTPDLDNQLFSAFTHFVCDKRISSSQVAILVDRLCEKARNNTTHNDPDKIFFVQSLVEKNTDLAARLASAYQMSLQNVVHDATESDPAIEALLSKIFDPPTD